MDTTKNLCRSAGRPTIRLERRTTAHAAELFALLAAPELYEFIEEEPLASVEAWRQKLERSESGRSPDGTEHWLNWIVRDASGAAAGYVQATVHASRETSVAYLFAAAFQGRGIATEAVSQMLERVASEHGVTRFRIVAERRNSRSILLAQRLGFAEATPERAALAGIAPLDILLLKEVAPAGPSRRTKTSEMKMSDCGAPCGVGRLGFGPGFSIFEGAFHGIDPSGNRHRRAAGRGLVGAARRRRVAHPSRRRLRHRLPARG